MADLPQSQDPAAVTQQAPADVSGADIIGAAGRVLQQPVTSTPAGSSAYVPHPIEKAAATATASSPTVQNMGNDVVAVANQQPTEATADRLAAYRQAAEQRRAELGVEPAAQQPAPPSQPVPPMQPPAAA